MDDYRIQLDTYSGPMELLLYLIRRDEVDIYDIPIARILEQYLDYVRMLEVLDPDGVADFLVLAATLMEIKSRMLLPKPPPEETDDGDGLDPRADLVRQLLAYRAFREAAASLDRRADLHSRRFARPPLDLPAGEGEVDIEDVQIWDLLRAFNKLMSAVGAGRAFHEITYDDTPISLHALDITDRLEREGPSLPFSRIFEGRTRSEMIGLFLALLELIRQRRVRVEQTGKFGQIEVHLLDATPITEPADEPAKDHESADQPESEAVPESEPENIAPASGVEPTAGAIDDEEDEPDEYKARLDAIGVADVDLGRDLTRPAERDSEPDSVSGTPPDPGKDQTESDGGEQASP